MNLHEYHAKQLLAQYGVAIPPGEVCETPEAAKRIAERLLAQGAKNVAVKFFVSLSTAQKNNKFPMD